jgi:hypothetical protein
MHNARPVTASAGSARTTLAQAPLLILSHCCGAPTLSVRRAVLTQFLHAMGLACW